jgi:glycerate 2-kinase
MPRTAAQLRSDALAIWHAGLAAVRSDWLVTSNVRVDGDWLEFGDSADSLRLRLGSIGRIAVVGAGKAGAGMAAGLEAALGPQVLTEKRVSGWVNVPADCVRKLDAIHLHVARPAGVNEPTPEGAIGTEQILQIVSSLNEKDLCICLLSGGGSALLPAPVDSVSLAEKQALTRYLSAAGANIAELNTVRKQLSQIKGGGLVRHCRAGRLITLIISDVLGDPLDVIASGPTVPNSTTAADALAILERYLDGNEHVAPQAISYLRDRAIEAEIPVRQISNGRQECLPHVTNLIIGNNATAVDAAGTEAERRGYSHAMHAATGLEGPAEDVGRHLAQIALKMQHEPGPNCLITGGEPTVKLAPPEIRGKGGRNQQLVLAALLEVINVGTNPKIKIENLEPAVPAPRLALFSAGTDGEDGPTDAAGAIIDDDIFERLRTSNLDPVDYLRRNDAYHFFAALGGLIKTGPTHTNVCDVRVLLVDRP